MLVLTMFPPQTMMKRLWTVSSGSIAPLKPMVISNPRLPATLQMVRSRRLGTQAVEEAAIHAAVVHQPHVAVVAVGQDGFRAVAADDFLHAPGDLIQGFLPGDAGEGAFALAAGPFQGMQHPVGVVYPGGKMARFVTDGSPGDRMVRITVDPNDPSLLQGNGEAAGVGAVQRADGSDDGLRMRGRHGLSPPFFPHCIIHQRSGKKCCRGTAVAEGNSFSVFFVSVNNMSVFPWCDFSDRTVPSAKVSGKAPRYRKVVRSPPFCFFVCVRTPDLSIVFFLPLFWIYNILGVLRIDEKLLVWGRGR